MSAVARGEGSEDLNESWVELNYQMAQKDIPTLPSHSDVTSDHSLHNISLEKLLIEAQRESRTPSVHTSNSSSQRGSPKSPNSPHNELASGERGIIKEEGVSDWIWDWSSRPEIQPTSSEWTRFKHPVPKRPKLSVRSSNVMKSSLFRWENLPTLFISHACSVFLGAALMYVYVKKYCNWATTAASAMD